MGWVGAVEGGGMCGGKEGGGGEGAGSGVVTKKRRKRHDTCALDSLSPTKLSFDTVGSDAVDPQIPLAHKVKARSDAERGKRASTDSASAGGRQEGIECEKRR